MRLIKIMCIQFKSKKLLAVILVTALSLLGGCTSLSQQKSPSTIKYVETHKPVHALAQSTAQTIGSLTAALQKAGAQVWAVNGHVRIIVPADQIFVRNTANLQSEHELLIQRVAELMRLFKTISASVCVYADVSSKSVQEQQHQLALTSAQASVVQSAISYANPNVRFIYAKGFGAEHAVAPNSSADGRYFNRRIEISFYYYVNKPLV